MVASAEMQECVSGRIQERDEDKLVVTVHNDINGTSSNWVLTRRSATWNGFAVAARRAIRREDFVFTQHANVWFRPALRRRRLALMRELTFLACAPGLSFLGMFYVWHANTWLPRRRPRYTRSPGRHRKNTRDQGGHWFLLATLSS